PLAGQGEVFDRQGQPAGQDRRDRVAGRGGVRPAVGEQGALGGEAIEVGGGVALVAVGADVIGAHGVDGDEKDVEVGREPGGGSGETRRRRAPPHGRVAADAVVVDAV